jgi:hypothetical protein
MSPAYRWKKAVLEPDLSDSTLLGAINFSEPVNDEYVDLTGNGHEATFSSNLIESPIKNVSHPIFGGGVLFTKAVGNENNILTVSSPTTFVNESAGTIACVARFTDNASGVWEHIFFALGSGGHRITLSKNVSQLILQVNSTSGTSTAATSITTWGERPMCIVATWEQGAATSLYIDGVLRANGAAIGSINSLTAIYIGKNSSTGSERFGGNLYGQFCSYSQVKSAGWIAEKCDRALQTSNFQTTYGANVSTSAITSGFLENTPFQVQSGSFEISEERINGVSTKVIECVTSGIIYVPTSFFAVEDSTEAAYGTWEWWWMKGAASSTAEIFFINDSQNVVSSTGYVFKIFTNNALYFNRVVSGSQSSFCSTAASYVNDEQWHSVRITRSAAGSFTFYINNDLMDVSGGSGTNPVTEATNTSSDYFVLDIDIGDKIAFAGRNHSHSIVKYTGVVKP